jgi:hypothetical protein
MSGRDELVKGGVLCNCGSQMIQTVGRLNFSLAGTGWSDHGYGITEYERLNNLDGEKRIEELANDPKIRKKMEGKS